MSAPAPAELPAPAYSGWIAPLNAAAAILHAAQAVTVLALAVWLDNRSSSQHGVFADGRIPVYRVASLYAPGANSTVASVQAYGALDIRALIVTFFALSSLFQTLASAFFGGRSGRMRYLEYSISASVMVLAIAAEAGIRDAYTLAGQFVLTWVTMHLGLMADSVQLAYASPDVSVFEAWLWLAPHVAGWATCLTAYAPILDVFLLNASPPAGYAGPPDFVRVIVFLQFALFMVFGVVQLAQLVQRTLVVQQAAYAPLHYWNSIARGHSTSYAAFTQKTNTITQFSAIDDAAELAYIGLSLVAKTLLGWIVLSPLLTSV
jgi:hypothetical protein